MVTMSPYEALKRIYRVARRDSGNRAYIDQVYESYKRDISALNLEADEYEHAIRNLCEILKY
jgi:hypothetical protein